MYMIRETKSPYKYILFHNFLNFAQRIVITYGYSFESGII